jgi:hypothetical protein
MLLLLLLLLLLIKQHERAARLFTHHSVMYGGSCSWELLWYLLTQLNHCKQMDWFKPSIFAKE